MTKRKIRHDLLIKLGQIMRSVKPENVNMSLIAKEPVCGSVGCAMGHAAMNKTFQDVGLSLVITDWGNVGLKYKGKVQDYDIVGAKIFGITEQEAFSLFSPAWAGENDKNVFLERFRSFMKSKNLHM